MLLFLGRDWGEFFFFFFCKKRKGVGRSLGIINGIGLSLSIWGEVRVIIVITFFFPRE